MLNTKVFCLLVVFIFAVAAESTPGETKVSAKTEDLKPAESGQIFDFGSWANKYPRSYGGYSTGWNRYPGYGGYNTGYGGYGSGYGGYGGGYGGYGGYGGGYGGYPQVGYGTNYLGGGYGGYGGYGGLGGYGGYGGYGGNTGYGGYGGYGGNGGLSSYNGYNSNDYSGNRNVGYGYQQGTNNDGYYRNQYTNPQSVIGLRGAFN